MYGNWESEMYDECVDALNVLKRWKGQKGNYTGRKGLEKRLRKRGEALHNGDFSIFNGLFDLTSSP